MQKDESLFELYKRVGNASMESEDLKSKKSMAKLILDVDSKYGNKKSKTLLDVACGRGKLLLALKGRYKLMGLDIDKNNINYAKKFVKGVDFSIDNMLNFNLNQKFDIITCFDAIDHGNELRRKIKRTLSNFYKHLTIGGLLIFNMPLAKETWKNCQFNTFGFYKHGNRYLWLFDKYIDRDMPKSHVSIVVLKSNGKIEFESKIIDIKDKLLNTSDVASIAKMIGFEVYIYTQKKFGKWTTESAESPLFICKKKSVS